MKIKHTRYPMIRYIPEDAPTLTKDELRIISLIEAEFPTLKFEFVAIRLTKHMSVNDIVIRLNKTKLKTVWRRCLIQDYKAMSGHGRKIEDGVKEFALLLIEYLGMELAYEGIIDDPAWVEKIQPYLDKKDES